MTTPYERPTLSRTQKKLMWAFLIGVLAVSLFMFQAVTYTAQQKEIREQSKQENTAPGEVPPSDSAAPTSPTPGEGSASEPTQVK